MLTRRNFLGWTAGALAAAGTFEAHAAQAGDVPLAIVTSRHSPIQRLSRTELRQLYLGAQLQAPGGERIRALHQMPETADRLAFEHQVTGMQPGELAQHWLERRSRGESGAPLAVTSVDTLNRIVSHRVHSISYVRCDQVGPGLRVIPIDGALPGDASYPLLADVASLIA